MIVPVMPAVLLKNLCRDNETCVRSFSSCTQARVDENENVKRRSETNKESRVSENVSIMLYVQIFLTDIEAKTRDVEALRTQILGLETELRSTRDVAVRAEAFLTTRQRSTKAYYFDTKLGGLAKPVSPQPRRT